MLDEAAQGAADVVGAVEPACTPSAEPSEAQPEANGEVANGEGGEPASAAPDEATPAAAEPTVKRSRWSAPEEAPAPTSATLSSGRVSRWGAKAAADPPAKKSRWGAKEPAPPPNPLQARLDEVNR